MNTCMHTIYLTCVIVPINIPGSWYCIAERSQARVDVTANDALWVLVVQTSFGSVVDVDHSCACLIWSSDGHIWRERVGGGKDTRYTLKICLTLIPLDMLNTVPCWELWFSRRNHTAQYWCHLYVHKSWDYFVKQDMKEVQQHLNHWQLGPFYFVLQKTAKELVQK